LLVILTITLTLPSTLIRPVITQVSLWTGHFENFKEAWAFAGQVRFQPSQLRITRMPSDPSIVKFRAYLRSNDRRRHFGNMDVCRLHEDGRREEEGATRKLPPSW
jgi:hypothetical protein